LFNGEFEEGYSRRALPECNRVHNHLLSFELSVNRECKLFYISDLKRELGALETKQLELEAAGSKRFEVGLVIEQSVELAKQFQATIEQGTVEEKRLLIQGWSPEP